MSEGEEEEGGISLGLGHPLDSLRLYIISGGRQCPYARLRAFPVIFARVGCWTCLLVL